MGKITKKNAEPKYKLHFDTYQKLEIGESTPGLEKPMLN
jgi:hypothetical protein